MVCYWTVNTSKVLHSPPISQSFLILWDLVTWTVSHTHAHTTGEEGEKGKTKFVAGEFCCDLIIQLVKLLGTGGKNKTKTSTIRRRPQMSSAGRVQQCSLDSVLPQKAKREKKSTFRLASGSWFRQSHWNVSGFVVSFPPTSSPSPAIEALIMVVETCLQLPWGLNRQYGCVRVLIVSVERTQGTLVSHSESHCAGPKTCAGSEERVLLMSCTGYKVQRSRTLWGSCWWHSVSPRRPHCKERTGVTTCSVMLSINFKTSSFSGGWSRNSR